MKKLLVMLTLILVMSTCSAELLETTSFSDLGYGSFYVEGAENEECEEYSFNTDLNITDLNTGTPYYVLSLHAEFIGAEYGKGRIHVYLNNDDNYFLTIIPESLNENGIFRVVLPKEDLEYNNSMKICAQTSETINNIGVFLDSAISKHYLPDFSGDGFVVYVDNSNPKTKEEFTIHVRLRNYGNEDVSVDLRYRKETLDREIPELAFLKGPTEYSGFLKKCSFRNSEGTCLQPDEIEFDYVVKGLSATEMRLLPATISFTNDFGEEVLLESNRLRLKISDPEIDIIPFFILDEQILQVGEEFEGKLAIKNEGPDALYNIEFEIIGGRTIDYGEEEGISIIAIGSSLEFGDNGNGTVLTLLPAETKYLEFTAKADAPGRYELGCVISYTDYNAMESHCDAAYVTYQGFGVDPVLVAAIIMLLIGLGVFSYFYFKKPEYT